MLTSRTIRDAMLLPLDISPMATRQDQDVSLSAIAAVQGLQGLLRCYCYVLWPNVCVERKLQLQLLRGHEHYLRKTASFADRQHIYLVICYIRYTVGVPVKEKRRKS